MGDLGLEAFCTAAERGGAFPSLTSLNVNINKIGDRGAFALAEAWRRGALTGLLRLSLSENSNCERGAQAFADAASGQLELQEL